MLSLGLTGLLMAAGATAQVPAGAECGVQDRVQDQEDLWRSLLDASLRRDPGARRMLEDAAARPASEAVGSLAEILLDEWDVAPSHASMKTARLVHYVPPSFAELELEGSRRASPLVIVFGEVTAVGRAEKPRVHHSSGVEAVDRRCVDSFLRRRYRPARDENRFLRSEVSIICHVHLR